MSVKSRQCDPARIEGFLNRQLSESEQAMFEAHLGECPECRLALASKTAPDELWEKASRYLRRDDDEPDCSSGADVFAAKQDCSHTVEQVLASLQPTDDPRMLGRLGSHEVSGVVGAGAMGVVLKAFDRSLDRTVAIKVLAPHLASSGAARKRFAREAKAAAAVIHPNVMAIHSVSSEGALPYFVMPYLRGASLQRRLDGEGFLPVNEVLRIGSQIAAGLAAAHGQGLVHRDIKPANILLEEGVERVALTDFGLARAVDDATLTRTGVIAGTPQFMSPEQARGESVDQRSDLFSLGSVLYTMCTGRPPFRAETSYGILRRITDTDPRPIREINPDIPAWFCAIIAKLMSKQPEGRFDSAGEVAKLLEDCLAHVQQPTAVPLPEMARQLPSAERAKNPNPVASPKVSATFAARGRAIWLIGAVAIAFAAIFAGILIVLELNKGKLTIQSEADDVPVKIMQGDEVVEKLTVTKDGASVRIAAGQYVVEIGGGMDGLEVKNDSVNLQRGGKEVVRIVRRDRSEDGERRLPAPPATDLKRFQGVWMMNTCDSATQGFGDKLAVVRDWRWDVRGNEIIWARSHGKVWKMKFTIDPTKTPKAIDLAYLDGPHQGKKSLGRYRWGGIDGTTLWISVQDPGVDVPRPKSVGMRSGETSLMLLDRPDADKELASLQGNWALEVFYTDALPKPAGNYVGSQWVIKGNEMSWTGLDDKQIRMSFTIDPTKLPNQIDATFLSGPHTGEKSLGMYERRGSMLWLCLADPGSKVPRPTSVSYETLAGKTMIGLKPAARAPVREEKKDPKDEPIPGAAGQHAPREAESPSGEAPPHDTPVPELPRDSRDDAARDWAWAASRFEGHWIEHDIDEDEGAKSDDGNDDPPRSSLSIGVFENIPNEPGFARIAEEIRRVGHQAVASCRLQLTIKGVEYDATPCFISRRQRETHLWFEGRSGAIEHCRLCLPFQDPVDSACILLVPTNPDRLFEKRVVMFRRQNRSGKEKADDLQVEMQQIVGKWVLLGTEDDGEPVTIVVERQTALLKNLSVLKLQYTDADGKHQRGSLGLFPSTSSRAFTLDESAPNESGVSIVKWHFGTYDLKDDKLTLTFNGMKERRLRLAAIESADSSGSAVEVIDHPPTATSRRLSGTYQRVQNAD